MLGNAFQLAGCIVPFVLLFGLDRVFTSTKSVSFLNRIAHLIASDSKAMSQDRNIEIVRRRVSKIIKYEANMYGAWAVGYITIGYTLATASADWIISNLLIRLIVFLSITLMLVWLASTVSSLTTKKYADKIQLLQK
ncbi:hypothetical protein [Paenibacillus thermotolerans]|uniref:hypothetical protein n=1 Tax=Paenibacillus thermotolerans TaxID=3027807 RepID=UPI002368E611|nr:MULTISPECIES: hypothetical protein [unclassified Paenibacillus]